MMPLPEYRRWNRMTWDQVEAEQDRLGVPQRGHLPSDYRNRIAIQNALALDGKGIGAWHERWIHELEKHQRGEPAVLP